MNKTLLKSMALLIYLCIFIFINIIGNIRNPQTPQEVFLFAITKIRTRSLHVFVVRLHYEGRSVALRVRNMTARWKVTLNEWNKWWTHSHCRQILGQMWLMSTTTAIAQGSLGYEERNFWGERDQACLLVSVSFNTAQGPRIFRSRGAERRIRSGEVRGFKLEIQTVLYLELKVLWRTQRTSLPRITRDDRSKTKRSS